MKLYLTIIIIFLLINQEVCIDLNIKRNDTKLQNSIMRQNFQNKKNPYKKTISFKKKLLNKKARTTSSLRTSTRLFDVKSKTSQIIKLISHAMTAYIQYITQKQQEYEASELSFSSSFRTMEQIVQGDCHMHNSIIFQFRLFAQYQNLEFFINYHYYLNTDKYLTQKEYQSVQQSGGLLSEDDKEQVGEMVHDIGSQVENIIQIIESERILSCLMKNRIITAYAAYQQDRIQQIKKDAEEQIQENERQNGIRQWIWGKTKWFIKNYVSETVAKAIEFAEIAIEYYKKDLIEEGKQLIEQKIQQVRELKEKVVECFTGFQTREHKLYFCAKHGYQQGAQIEQSEEFDRVFLAFYRLNADDFSYKDEDILQVPSSTINHYVDQCKGDLTATSVLNASQDAFQKQYRSYGYAGKLCKETTPSECNQLNPKSDEKIDILQAQLSTVNSVLEKKSWIDIILLFNSVAEVPYITIWKEAIDKCVGLIVDFIQKGFKSVSFSGVVAFSAKIAAVITKAVVDTIGREGIKYIMKVVCIVAGLYQQRKEIHKLVYSIDNMTRKVFQRKSQIQRKVNIEEIELRQKEEVQKSVYYHVCYTTNKILAGVKQQMLDMKDIMEMLENQSSGSQNEESGDQAIASSESQVQASGQNNVEFLNDTLSFIKDTLCRGNLQFCINVLSSQTIENMFQLNNNDETSNQRATTNILEAKSFIQKQSLYGTITDFVVAQQIDEIKLYLGLGYQIIKETENYFALICRQCSARSIESINMYVSDQNSDEERLEIYKVSLPRDNSFILFHIKYGIYDTEIEMNNMVFVNDNKYRLSHQTNRIKLPSAQGISFYKAKNSKCNQLVQEQSVQYTYHKTIMLGSKDIFVILNFGSTETLNTQCQKIANFANSDLNADPDFESFKWHILSNHDFDRRFFLNDGDYNKKEIELQIESVKKKAYIFRKKTVQDQSIEETQDQSNSKGSLAIANKFYSFLCSQENKKCHSLSEDKTWVNNDSQNESLQQFIDKLYDEKVVLFSDDSVEREKKNQFDQGRGDGKCIKALNKIGFQYLINDKEQTYSLREQREKDHGYFATSSYEEVPEGSEYSKQLHQFRDECKTTLYNIKHFRMDGQNNFLSAQSQNNKALYKLKESVTQDQQQMMEQDYFIEYFIARDYKDYDIDWKWKLHKINSQILQTTHNHLLSHGYIPIQAPTPRLNGGNQEYPSFKDKRFLFMRRFHKYSFYNTYQPAAAWRVWTKKKNQQWTDALPVMNNLFSDDGFQLNNREDGKCYDALNSLAFQYDNASVNRLNTLTQQRNQFKEYATSSYKYSDSDSLAINQRMFKYKEFCRTTLWNIRPFQMKDQNNQLQIVKSKLDSRTLELEEAQSYDNEIPMGKKYLIEYFLMRDREDLFGDKWFDKLHKVGSELLNSVHDYLLKNGFTPMVVPNPDFVENEGNIEYDKEWPKFNVNLYMLMRRVKSYAGLDKKPIAAWRVWRRYKQNQQKDISQQCSTQPSNW